MNREDLARMLAAAELITIAAKRHEDSIRAALAMPVQPDDYLIGEMFSPVSQELANWRNLMAAMFPTPPDDPEKMAELADILETWK